MKERPILMSGAMVRAILDGKKTQTRRVIKEKICFGSGQPPIVLKVNGLTPPKCPYGLPGDRLWVRETWKEFRTETEEERAKSSAILKRFFDGKIKDVVAGAQELCLGTRSGPTQVLYAADFGDWAYSPDSDLKPWRPSIFMPRKYSRITLEVKSVRVERVQGISNDDAKAEGLRQQIGDGAGPGPGFKWSGVGYEGIAPSFFHAPGVDDYCCCHTGKGILSPAACAYRDRWDKLNFKRGFGWEKNPWVWVISFERVKL